jgi:hypothetical protein
MGIDISDSTRLYIKFKERKDDISKLSTIKKTVLQEKVVNTMLEGIEVLHTDEKHPSKKKKKR